MKEVSAIKFFIALAVVTLFFTATVKGQSKADSSHVWYQASNERDLEKGKLSEFQDKHHIYISYYFIGFFSPSHAFDVKKYVLSELAKYRGLEVVSNPDDAEGAILITVTDSLRSEPSYGEMASPLDSRNFDVHFYILTRGAQNKDGTYKSRLLWQRFSIGQGVATAAVSNHLRGFIKELKRIRNEK